MDVAFVTDWPKSDANICLKKLLGDYVCSWSCRNTFAFTTIGTLKNTEERETYRPQIHIIDPDRPWELCSISGNHKDLITVLEWEPSGMRLLSGDVDGRVLLWQMRNHLMNDWQCKEESYIPGEPIMALEWLHSVGKICYSIDKLDTSSWFDSYTHVPFKPSLQMMGSSPAQGWIAVTMQGMVSVTIINIKGTTTSSVRLSKVKHVHVAVADIAYQSSGHILIAVSDGSTRVPIQVFKISLTWKDEECRIGIEQLPSYHLRCALDDSIKDKYSNLTHLKFMNKECMEQLPGARATEQLIVCASRSTGTIVELCSLEREPSSIPVPPIFQTGMSINRERVSPKQHWVWRSSFQDTSHVTAIAVPKLPIRFTSSQPSSLSYSGPGFSFAVAFVDGYIKLLHTMSLKSCAAFRYEGVKHDSHGKRQKLLQGKHVICMEMSHTSCSLMGIDRTGAMFLMKLAPIVGQSLDQGAARAYTIATIVNLLQYCLVIGYDRWDIALSLTPNMIDAIIERLTEGFMRQPKATQEMLQLQFLSCKAALYRLAAGGSGKATDSQGKLLFLSLANLLRSQLQPLSFSPIQKGPIEQLTVASNCTTDTDVDKLVAKLDPRDFEIDASVLKSLHGLIQFIVDFVCYILSSYSSQVHTSSHKPGLLILKEHLALSLFREVFLLLRIWSISKPSAFPIFNTMSENVDTIPLIFKLVTSFWLCCKDEPPTEPGEDIIEECVLLSVQLPVPQWEFFPITEGILGKLHSFHHCRSFQFDTSPGNLISMVSFGLGPDKFSRAALDTLDKNTPKFDYVSGNFLGMKPADKLRRCTRCSCLSSIRPVSQISAARKMWEHNWDRTCLCGGLWKKVIRK